MKLSKGQKLLFIGDSITDYDRTRPAGEGLFGALGKGYVSLVDALLQSQYPELGIRVVNKGNGGNTIRDLKKRWQEDVLDQKVDCLVIMIGINDVWRQFDSPAIKEGHVYEEEYASTLRELVSETKSEVQQVVLMTPYYIEDNDKDAMRAKMDQYGAIVKSIAEEYDVPCVDTQAVFNKLLSHMHSSNLAWDRVHPSLPGHMALARSFLDEVGFDWNKR